jgi:hypothetical protein
LEAVVIRVTLSFLRALGVVAALTLVNTSAFAAPVLVIPGGPNVTPSLLTVGAPPPLLYSTSGTVSIGSLPNALTVDYQEYVFNDIFGVTCATCLDFAFAVADDAASTLGITRLGMPVPLSVTTYVGYIAGAGGSVAPSSANRGSIVGSTSFLFPFPGGSLVPGGPGSDILVIATDATAFTLSSQIGIDAVTNTGAVLGGFGAIQGTIAGPVPAGPVPLPEPSPIYLIETGLLGIGAWRVRKRAVK